MTRRGVPPQPRDAPEGCVSSHGRSASDLRGMSRRHLLGSTTAGLAAGTLGASGLAGTASATDAAKDRERVLPTTERRILLKGGVVLTMDPAIGDLEQGDVLIEGARIAEVARTIDAPAQVVDVAGMIVMPGFIDTHHHQYETIQRSIIADGILRGDWPERTYFSVVQALWTSGRTRTSTWGARLTSLRTTTSRSSWPR